MKRASDRERLGRLTFGALVGAYVLVWLWYFPVTYAIDDEANILSLALAQGTPFLELVHLNVDAELEWRGHRISKFSPFHAALLVPAVATQWRLAFVVAPSFFLAGGFVFRGMLRRAGLSEAWSAVYFLQPGMLYYSRTLLGMVPASVLSLVGVSLLLRDRPRPVAAGAAFGAAVLLHLWLAPVAILFATLWWIERAGGDLRPLGRLAAGALPFVVLMGLYNVMVTGHALLTPYWILNHHLAFDGRYWPQFLVFYLCALAVAPLAGWAALSPRHSRTWAIPLTCAAVIVLAAFYYYRDGIGHGIAGWVPGMRFLLPVSLLAALPAASCLSSHAASLRWTTRPAAHVAVVATFVLSAVVLSRTHQQYLDAQAGLQASIRRSIPDGAVVVANAEAFKAFAPVNGRWKVHFVRDGLPPTDDRAGVYRVWMGRSGERPSPAWFNHRTPLVTQSRSWTWARTLWVAPGS